MSPTPKQTAPSPELQIRTFNLETDFPAIATCLFDSFHNPPQTFFHIYFPILTTRQAAIDECADRLKTWHTADPTSNWRVMIDPAEPHKIAGASLWHFYTAEEKGGEAGEQVQHGGDGVDWFTRPGHIRYAEEFIARHEGPRKRTVNGAPYVYCFMMFTSPEYRGRGICQRLLDWGLGEADKLGLEVYLDATWCGKPVYEKERNGFVPVEEFEVMNWPWVEEEGGEGVVDEDWREIEQKVGRQVFWLMRRPVGGGRKEGEGK